MKLRNKHDKLEHDLQATDTKLQKTCCKLRTGLGFAETEHRKLRHDLRFAETNQSNTERRVSKR